MAFASLTKREKTILAFTIIFVLLISVYRFLIEGAVKKWQRLNTEILISKATLQKNLRIIDREKFIESEYEKYNNFVIEEGSQEKKMASLLKEIEGLASKWDVAITDIKPLPTKTTEFFNRYTVELSAEADISQISKFIYYLQKSSKILRAERLRLNAKSGQPNILQAQMLITRILVP